MYSFAIMSGVCARPDTIENKRARSRTNKYLIRHFCPTFCLHITLSAAFIFSPARINTMHRNDYTGHCYFQSNPRAPARFNDGNPAPKSSLNGNDNFVLFNNKSILQFVPLALHAHLLIWSKYSLILRLPAVTKFRWKSLAEKYIELTFNILNLYFQSMNFYVTFSRSFNIQNICVTCLFLIWFHFHNLKKRRFLPRQICSVEKKFERRIDKAKRNR